MVGDGAVEEEEDDTERNRTPAAAAGELEEEEEGIEGLLEPFTRDELLDLLVDACLRDPALRSRLAAIAASDAASSCTASDPASLTPRWPPSPPSARSTSATQLPTAPPAADAATASSPSAAAPPRAARSPTSPSLDGLPVACQLASLSPTSPDRKLFVDNVPARAAHDELRRLFSRFGEIEAGPLSTDRATGQFRGYAFYKSPEGLAKALEERKVMFDGCELHCRRAQRINKEKHLVATHADAGAQNNEFVNDTSPIVHVQPKELTLTSTTQTLLRSNWPIESMAKGASSGTVSFCQNAGLSGLVSWVHALWLRLCCLRQMRAHRLAIWELQL